MDALHQAGGVPPGWQLSPGEGVVARGRAAFVDLGCHDESFAGCNARFHRLEMHR